MLAAVASVNSAERLKKYLYEKKSVSSRIIQTPSSLAKDGCGYSLRFPDAEKRAVDAAARELRINIRAFYRENGSEYEKV